VIPVVGKIFKVKPVVGKIFKVLPVVGKIFYVLPVVGMIFYVLPVVGKIFTLLPVVGVKPGCPGSICWSVGPACASPATQHSYTGYTHTLKYT